jgi:hypothetical protein
MLARPEALDLSEGMSAAQSRAALVKRITPSSTGNGQRFGQGEARYDQRTFVRVETKSGVAPGLCQLAELLQSEPSGHHQRGSATKPEVFPFRKKFQCRRLWAAGTRLSGRLAHRLSSWILPRLIRKISRLKQAVSILKQRRQ